MAKKVKKGLSRADKKKAVRGMRKQMVAEANKGRSKGAKVTDW